MTRTDALEVARVLLETRPDNWTGSVGERALWRRIGEALAPVMTRCSILDVDEWRHRAGLVSPPVLTESEDPAAPVGVPANPIEPLNFADALRDITAPRVIVDEAVEFWEREERAYRAAMEEVTVPAEGW